MRWWPVFRTEKCVRCHKYHERKTMQYGYLTQTREIKRGYLCGDCITAFEHGRIKP